MTVVELRDALLGRVGWKQPTGFQFTLSAEVTATASGLYFQDGYPMVELNRLVALQRDVDIDQGGFNAYLTDLKRQTVTLVVSDVLEQSFIHEDVLTDRPNVFDDAIMKRMAIIVGEIILTSNRSNSTERLSKEQIQQLFFEINGNSEGSSNPNPNFPTYVGLKSRYGRAISRVKDYLDQEKSLDSFTFALPNYDELDDGKTYFIFQ